MRTRTQLASLRRKRAAFGALVVIGIACVVALTPLGHLMLDPARLRRHAERLEEGFGQAGVFSPPRAAPPAPEALAAQWRQASDLAAVAQSAGELGEGLRRLADGVARLRTIQGADRRIWGAYLASWQPPADLVRLTVVRDAVDRARFLAIRDTTLGGELLRVDGRKRCLAEIDLLERRLPEFMARHDVGSLTENLGGIYGEKNPGARLMLQEWQRLQAERAAALAWLPSTASGR